MESINVFPGLALLSQRSRLLTRHLLALCLVPASVTAGADVTPIERTLAETHAASLRLQEQSLRKTLA